jgi:hypothetical protein
MMPTTSFGLPAGAGVVTAFCEDAERHKAIKERVKSFFMLVFDFEQQI